MTELRLASWNLLHGRSLTNGQVDEDELRAGARRLGADVVALQEVDRGQLRSGGTDQAAAVAEATGASWWKFVPAVWGVPGQQWEPAATEHDERGDRSAYGIGLVSRLPVLGWDILRFPAAPVGMPLLVPGRGMVKVDDEPRLAISAVLSGPRGPFTVVGTHLSFVPGFNVRQLRQLTQWVVDKPAPRLLLGDLNLPGRLPAWISGWTQLAQVPTYPSWKPRVQLDHALGQGIAPHQVLSVESERLPVSDHNALAVTVTL